MWSQHTVLAFSHGIWKLDLKIRSFWKYRFPGLLKNVLTFKSRWLEGRIVVAQTSKNRWELSKRRNPNIDVEKLVKLLDCCKKLEKMFNAGYLKVKGSENDMPKIWIYFVKYILCALEKRFSLKSITKMRKTALLNFLWKFKMWSFSDF